ncbi:PQQ-dependent sugar dehydrogenase [bacterium]|nr:PQQ-dependent sugar dehydrogenase [bacterium]
MTDGHGNRSAGIFSRSNLPYLVVILLAVTAIVTFLRFVGLPTSVSAADQTTTTQVIDTATTTTTEPATTTSLTIVGSTTSSTTEPETTTTIGTSLGDLAGLALEQVATDIPQPTYATGIPGTTAIAVLERQGRIRVIEAGAGLLPDPYLNLLDRVGSGGIENGLLGLAFHPDFATNGRLFVHYTDALLDTRVSEFTADPLSFTVDAATEKAIIELPQEGIRNRGGMLTFGPDGYLYMSFGDADLGDRSAQDTDSLFGTIARIDVDTGDPYAIPADNPFPDGAAPEVWAHGLRNPWRFSIDADSGLMFIGDVGQKSVEEINVYDISAEDAPDFGWPDFEGTSCFLPSDSCQQEGWVSPVFEYTHDEGCAVTGGFVYRGEAIPELDGQYFFADWCNGWISSFAYADGAAGDMLAWGGDLQSAGQVASFGLDSAGELLVVTSEGTISRIVAVR